MSDEDALLAGIAAAPHDLLPRLAYADWLDDRGDAVRAEVVRLEVHLAGGGGSDGEEGGLDGFVWFKGCVPVLSSFLFLLISAWKRKRC